MRAMLYVLNRDTGNRLGVGRDVTMIRACTLTLTVRDIESDGFNVEMAFLPDVTTAWPIYSDDDSEPYEPTEEFDRRTDR